MKTFIAILTRILDGLHWKRRRCAPSSTMYTPTMWGAIPYSFAVDWYDTSAVDHRCSKCKKVVPSCLRSDCSLERIDSYHGSMAARDFRRLPTP